MCGRFAQKLPSSRLVDMFGTTPLKANVPPNYNVAPTQTAMVVFAHPEKKERELAVMQWGLIPPWSKTGKMEFATFNAKSETVATAASYRSAFKSRRCIALVDAFYEWKKLSAGPKPAKQPYAIGRADGEPVVLAGLWEGWKQPSDRPQSAVRRHVVRNSKEAELFSNLPEAEKFNSCA
jgi:putative SOS response-associated peptidase YedK